MSHTPGPWFVDQFGHVYGWTDAKPLSDGGVEKTTVCLIDSRASSATTGDKRLIAAAPELLAALEAAMTAMQRHYNVGQFSDMATIHMAGAAIRKAKGDA